jgi:ATP-dependent DNA helicase RecG
LSDLKLPLIRSFLKEVGSGLYEVAARTPLDILCRQMNIVNGADEYLKPRNVGVMFFHESPEQFFPGAQIEVVHFPEGVAGKNIEEKTFKGPLDQQLRDALAYLRNAVIKEKVTKSADRAEAQRIFNYPYAALEEALVNAVYHRSYEQREPIEVRIHPGRIEIASYPGPDPSIRLEALNSGRIAARRYRNRRLGEFLKELKLTEGRATGIPTILEAMKQNGSPPPRFETDEGRTYFLAELLSHSEMQEQQWPQPLGLADEDHDPDHDEDHDELSQTELQIIRILADGSKNTSQIATQFGYTRRTGSLLKTIDRLKKLNLIDLTIPDKPRSKNQKFKLTDRGYRIAKKT